MSIPTSRISVFLPAMFGGGAERTMLNIAEGIAARGHSVDLVLVRSEGPLMAEVPPSVRIVDLHASRDLFGLPALVRYLRREHPEALLSGLHTNLIAVWARCLARVPVRVVVSERNTLSSKVQHYSGDLRMRLMPLLIRRFYPWADHIVAVSKGVADDLTSVARISSEQIRVIYNPVVTPELQAKAKVVLDHPWFEPGAPPVILSAGRLTAQKDFSTLIRAFAQVRENHNARLIILGEGEERAALEMLVRQLGLTKDVSLPGFVSNPCPFMARAFLFVLPSRWEGLPGVLIEAMFCGALLISTDCPGGAREILRDGEYGRLVPVGDVAALSRTMEDALAGKISPPPRESWKPFEMETIVDQYINILVGNL
jgi:glycosyltransferase involved in cell wall biosynthesis